MMACVAGLMMRRSRFLARPDKEGAVERRDHKGRDAAHISRKVAFRPFLCAENPRLERGFRRAYSYAQNCQTLF